MRKTLLIAAATATLIGAPAAMAEQFKVDLSPSDPQYKSPECVAMRAKMQTYKNGMFDQSTGTYIITAVTPGGTLGFFALQHRKDELFRRDIEQACMSKPPDRSYLDKPVGR